MKFTVSLAQFQIDIGQPEKNLVRATPLIQAAASAGSDLILFPELWTSGYDLAAAQLYAAQNAKLLPVLAQISRDQQLAIGGSYITERHGRHYNTFVLLYPAGQAAVCYDKLHLFRLMQEEQWLGAGTACQTAAFPWGEAGLSICYDLRFPELYRQYAVAGAQAAWVVAEWPQRRIAHWQTLLRSRAIENQMFVAGVNAVGPIGDAVYGGCSAIISPWGDTLVEGSPTEEALLTAALDFDLVGQARRTIPVFQDRRTDLYR
ncbi:MAG TPA: nitrilase-related carbon-nitrogen hydrolase [Anaerolineaceae bacterium]|nr:nitrilase-related carbon-nitrogen hydrolase [Anaerolineaceae bacterium]